MAELYKIKWSGGKNKRGKKSKKNKKSKRTKQSKVKSHKKVHKKTRKIKGGTGALAPYPEIYIGDIQRTQMKELLQTAQN